MDYLEHCRSVAVPEAGMGKWTDEPMTIMYGAPFSPSDPARVSTQGCNEVVSGQRVWVRQNLGFASAPGIPPVALMGRQCRPTGRTRRSWVPMPAGSPVRTQGRNVTETEWCCSAPIVPGHGPGGVLPSLPSAPQQGAAATSDVRIRNLLITGIAIGGGFLLWRWLWKKDKTSNPRSGRWKLMGGGEVELEKTIGRANVWQVSYRYEDGPWRHVGDIKYYPDTHNVAGIVGDHMDVFSTLDEAVAFVVREGGFQQRAAGPVPLFGIPERNPAKERTVYLAVMPRQRKPRAVGAIEAGWYRQNARKFYEVTGPGMTAAKARELIKRGKVEPTWVDGRPVEKLPEDAVATLDELFDLTDEWMAKVGGMGTTRLRLGHEIWVPIFDPRPGGRWKYVYHKMGSHPALYHEEPMVGRDLEKALGRQVRLDLMVEDYARGLREHPETRPWRVASSHYLHGKLSRQHLGW